MQRTLAPLFLMSLFCTAHAESGNCPPKPKNEDVRKIVHEAKNIVVEACASQSCLSEFARTCWPNIRTIANETEIRSAFQAAKRDTNLNMKDPSGLCLQRAYLMSKKLFELGIASEIMNIKGLALIGSVKDESGKFSFIKSYANHSVTVVRVLNKDGNEITLVLDPQFLTEPLPLKEYFHQLTGSDCEPKQKKGDCQYSMALPQLMSAGQDTAEPSVNSEAANFFYRCDWQLAKSFQKEIQSSNLKAQNTNRLSLPAGLSPSASEQEVLRWAYADAESAMIADVSDWEREITALGESGDPTERAILKAIWEESLDASKKRLGQFRSKYQRFLKEL